MTSKDRNAVVARYAELAPQYDRRWWFYTDATLRETLSRLELQAEETLLDVGCGTGVLLEALLTSMPSAQLSGADPSPEMLELARKKLGEAVILKLGHAKSLPFPDQNFDVVVSTNAFHYFRDPQGALEDAPRPAGLGLQGRHRLVLTLLPLAEKVRVEGVGGVASRVTRVVRRRGASTVLVTRVGGGGVGRSTLLLVVHWR